MRSFLVSLAVGVMLSAVHARAEAPTLEVVAGLGSSSHKFEPPFSSTGDQVLSLRFMLATPVSPRWTVLFGYKYLDAGDGFLNEAIFPTTRADRLSVAELGFRVRL